MMLAALFCVAALACGAHAQSVQDIRFLLWTRSNKADVAYYPMIPGDTANLNNSPFSGSRTTYFLVHGWNSNGLTDFIVQGKTELLNLYDCNVIAVDWQVLADIIQYDVAVANVYLVGPYLADFINFLVAQSSLRMSQVNIVGHSLGAHVSGLAGKNVAGTVSRITGLDPAGPLFYDKPNSQRLYKTDASFVDIIHSNGGQPIDGCIGILDAIGHEDFYPNGGSQQVGCGIIIGADYQALFGGCSHGRSHQYWVESISAGASLAKDFVSWPCTSWSTFNSGSCTSCGTGCLNMGFHVDQSQSGSYYLRTNNAAPFAYGNAQ